MAYEHLPMSPKGSGWGRLQALSFFTIRYTLAFCEVVAGTGEIEFVSLWGEAVIGLVGLGLQKLGCE